MCSSMRRKVLLARSIDATWRSRGIEQRKMLLYINGIMAGHNERADNFEERPIAPLSGKPMMVTGISARDRVLDGDAIYRRYQSGSAQGKRGHRGRSRPIAGAGVRRAAELKRNSSDAAYECSFTREKRRGVDTPGADRILLRLPDGDDARASI